jgi:NAD+ diphosphatase
MLSVTRRREVNVAEGSRFVPHFRLYPDFREIPKDAWVFVFHDQSMLVREKEQIEMPEYKDLENDEFPFLVYLGMIDQKHCYATLSLGKVTGETETGCRFIHMRKLHRVFEPDIYGTAISALHLINWYHKAKYCGRCGCEMEDKQDERARICVRCRNVVYPVISPAVLVAITHEDKILLATSPKFPRPFYSVIAGFVEVGESFEEAIHREVMEEVGVEVENIKYFGSQPWPFPSTIMVGFTADYKRGEVTPDELEITDARWFTVDELPELPGRVSLSRKMIDWFINKSKEGN